PKYQGRLANMTAPDLQAEFRTTRPFAAIASAIKEWADERASILTALEDNPNLDLSPGDRTKLANRVRAELRWGSPGNSITRLINEHRASQLDLGGLVGTAVQTSQLPDELDTSKFVQDLKTRISQYPYPLTREVAEDLAQKEVTAFARGKADCLDWLRE